jgi:hypothetical protein
MMLRLFKEGSVGFLLVVRILTVKVAILVGIHVPCDKELDTCQKSQER